MYFLHSPFDSYQHSDEDFAPSSRSAQLENIAASFGADLSESHNINNSCINHTNINTNNDLSFNSNINNNETQFYHWNENSSSIRSLSSNLYPTPTINSSIENNLNHNYNNNPNNNNNNNNNNTYNLIPLEISICSEPLDSLSTPVESCSKNFRTYKNEKINDFSSDSISNHNSHHHYHNNDNNDKSENLLNPFIKLDENNSQSETLSSNFKDIQLSSTYSLPLDLDLNPEEEQEIEEFKTLPRKLIHNNEPEPKLSLKEEKHNCNNNNNNNDYYNYNGHNNELKSHKRHQNSPCSSLEEESDSDVTTYSSESNETNSSYYDSSPCKIVEEKAKNEIVPEDILAGVESIINNYVENMADKIQNSILNRLAHSPYFLHKNENNENSENSLKLQQTQSPNSINSSNSNYNNCNNNINNNDNNNNNNNNFCRISEIPNSNRLRLNWTDELKTRFDGSVDMLGGFEYATPKNIKTIMNVQGLTTEHIKSHLQKCRRDMKKKKKRKRKGKEDSVPKRKKRKLQTMNYSPENLEVDEHQEYDDEDLEEMKYQRAFLTCSGTRLKLELMENETENDLDSFHLENKVSELDIQTKSILRETLQECYSQGFKMGKIYHQTKQNS